MVFLSCSYYNRFASLIIDPRKDTLKGNNNYPGTVIRAYDILTCFDLAPPRCHCTDRTGDKGNRENCGGRGGRDHTFFQHTVPSGTVFITYLKNRMLYRIKRFNCEKWGHYDKQLPEPTIDGTPKKSGQNMAQTVRYLTQGSSGGAVSNKWLLLESYSTISCAQKKKLYQESL